MAVLTDQVTIITLEYLYWWHHGLYADWALWAGQAQGWRGCGHQLLGQIGRRLQNEITFSFGHEAGQLLLQLVHIGFDLQNVTFHTDGFLIMLLLQQPSLDKILLLGLLSLSNVGEVQLIQKSIFQLHISLDMLNFIQ